MRNCYFLKRSYGGSRIEINRKLDLLFIRHAESTNNILHSYPQSDPNWKNKREADCGLSRKGLQQLECLGDYVKSGQWDTMLPSPAVYYCSPMKRCLETMNSITSSLPHTTTTTTTAPQQRVEVQSRMYEFGGCYRVKDDQIIGETGMNNVRSWRESG